MPCISLSFSSWLFISHMSQKKFIWHLFAISHHHRLWALYNSATLTCEQKLYCATTAPENISSEFYLTAWFWTSKMQLKTATSTSFRWVWGDSKTATTFGWQSMTTVIMYFRRVVNFLKESKFSTELCFYWHRTCLFLLETFSSLIKPLTTLFMFWNSPSTTLLTMRMSEGCGFDTSTNALAYSWLMESIQTFRNNQRLLCT